MTHHHSKHKEPEHPADADNAGPKPEQAAEQAVNVEAQAEAAEGNPNLPVEITPEQRIASLEEELAGAHDRHLRLQAEYQNYRKRVSKDISTARYIAMTDAVTPFLQVLDYMNMAMAAAETSDNLDAIRQGLKMIMGEYQKAMDELGVEKVNAAGEKFNPELHEALANEASEEIPEGNVIKQWSCGYKLGERLLRPAKVVVSSGPGNAADKQEG
ncbi:MAG: nucleotide exchange factor GrpE [Victivallaceae bacterium]